MKLIYSQQICIQMRIIWTNKAAEFKHNRQAGTQKLCYVYCQTIFFIVWTAHYFTLSDGS